MGEQGIWILNVSIAMFGGLLGKKESHNLCNGVAC